MSFLLQEPKRQSIKQSGGRSRLSVRNSKNNNAVARNIVGDNSRIFPGSLGSRGFNAGNLKLSKQQISGNQIMLQRQKSKTTTKKMRTQQHQRQERQNHQRQEQSAKLTQENLGDYTMDRVMQDLHILEQQQCEAKRKLVSAQTTKQKRLDQQRQLNALLENKSYSNGALRAKLRQSHEFLSVATRELSNRKLVTDRLQGEIADFECKLKRGLRSAKTIQICGAKIDSSLIVTEHKIANMRRLKMQAMQTNTEIRRKFLRTKKKDQILRLAIQDTHKRTRKWGEEKVSLRTQIIKLDKDKMVAQNTDQSTELQINSIHDSIKAEADHVTSLQRTLSRDFEETTKQKEAVSSEIKAGSTTFETLKLEVQSHQEKITECKKIEGQARAKDVSPYFDQNVFRRDLERLEEESKKDEDESLAMKILAEDTEKASKISSERNLQNGREASIINVRSKSLTEDEEKRQKAAVDFQVSLKYARTEVAKLEDSFQEMRENRASEACTNSKAISGCDVDAQQHIEMVENLKLKIKLEDTSLKTKIRLFEDTEKLKVLKKLGDTKKRSLSAAKKYQDAVDASSEEIIQSNLQADFEPKIDEETQRCDSKNKNLISRFDKYLKEFPCLEEIDCTFDEAEDRDKQIKMALAEVERDCTARKIAAKKLKEQKGVARKRRKTEVQAIRNKLKDKEEAQAQVKKRQFREETDRRISDAKVEDTRGIDLLEGLEGDSIPIHRNDTFVRRQRRRRKGSDFFNPRREGNDEMDDDQTPTGPRQLMSSFLSQSSGQRVRWMDHNVGDTDIGNDVNNGGEEGCVESRSEDRNLSKTRITTTSNDHTPQTSKNGQQSEPDSAVCEIQCSSIDTTSLKSTGRQPTGRKQTIDSGTFGDNGATSTSKGRKASSSTANGLFLTLKDSSDTSKSRKNNSTSKSRKRSSTNSHHREKNRRKSNQKDIDVPLFKETKEGQKRRSVPQEMNKVQPRKPEGSTSRVAYKEKGNVFYTAISEDMKGGKKGTHDTDLEGKEKRHDERTMQATNGSSMREKGHGRKSSNSRTRSKLTNKEPRKDRQRRSTNVLQDKISSKHGTTKLDKRASLERDSYEKDSERTNKSVRENFTERGVRRESRGEVRKKSNERTHIGKRRSPSPSVGRKETKGRFRKSSKSATPESSSAKGGKENSREMACTKPNSSTRATKKDSHGKASGESVNISRKKLSVGGTGKQVHRKDYRLSSTGVQKTKSTRGNGTKAHESLNASTSSASRGNENRTKRKAKGDNASVSSSKTNVGARRRKKRNTGLSQRSTTSNVRDESCDFKF